MPFTLDAIVPWGRSLEEYVRMFALESRDLDLRILGCGDGPASFNAERSLQQGQVVSVDPIYALDAETIRQRIEETTETVLAQTWEHRDRFRWDRIPDLESLRTVRLNAMNTFLADFEEGKRQGRYQTGELPNLPFEDNAFDLALCSHLLFLYGEPLDADFHERAILEMLRLAPEVRIFPLQELDGRPSRHLSHVRTALEVCAHTTEVRPVNYEFQVGANEMLVVRRG